MATVYHADTVGSLLRPQYLKLAREQSEAGQLEPAAYKEIEDRAVRGDPVGGAEASVRVREFTGRLLPGLPVGHLVGVEPDAQRARRVARQVAPCGASRARQQDEVPAEQVERGQPGAPAAQEDVRRPRAWLAGAVARVLVRRPAVARFGDDGG